MATAVPTATPTPTVASAGPPPAATPSGRAVAARVTVQRSGGLAGVTQEIVVESDGRWRYRVSRGRDAGTAKTGRLNAAQLKRLHLLLGDPSFGSAFYPRSCADGFHYSLRTGQRRVEWDDCGRGNPAEVVRAIVALLTDVTAF
ncbi:hypothetical protein G3554_23185 [Micromonospora sp. PPF5-17]|nr:hypothetical protein [Micromonospora solifontis]